MTRYPADLLESRQARALRPSVLSSLRPVAAGSRAVQSAIVQIGAAKKPGFSAMGTTSDGGGGGTVFASSPNAPGMTSLGFVPYSQASLESLASWVPALRNVDSRLVALLLAPRTAMGLLARMNAGGWFDDLFGDGSGDTSGDQTASGSGSSGDFGGDQTASGSGSSGDFGGGGSLGPPADQGGDGGGGGLLGEILGNPDAPGFQPNTPGNFDPANPGDVPQGGGGGGGTVPVGPDTQSTLDAEARLAKWNRGFAGACSPSDYGSTPGDLTGVADARFGSALASYQRWADSTKGEALPQTGTLDPATYASLKRTTDAMGSGSGTLSSSTSNTCSRAAR